MQLKSLYNYFAQHPEASWIMRPQNAQMLFEFIKKNPIKRVLDLGTGIGVSAAVVALALKEKGETNYHIDSIEQNDKCIRIAQQLIPTDLQEHITIHKSEVKIWTTEKMPHQEFSIFATLPEEQYDLIINDGPSPFMEDGHFIDIPNATITKLLLEEKLTPNTFIIWDGRLHMLRILERYFSDNFFIVQAGERSPFHILQRKDNPVAFRDDTLEMMKNSNYFENEKDMPTINRNSTQSETAVAY